MTSLENESRMSPNSSSRHETARRWTRCPAVSLALLFLLAAVGCAGAGDDGRPDDYLIPDLRAAVEQLKADVAMAPTDETTVAERARILADWVDAYALGGGEVGLEGPRVRLQATQPPTGQAAIAQGAVVDRLVRQFALHDEPGALGELAAESLGPFEARSYQTIRQTWTAGSRPVATGGGFWVARHFNVNYGPFQTDDPAGDGYVAIDTSDGDAAFEADVYMARGPHGGFRAPEPALVFRVASGQVDPGETVTITYGDTTGGGQGLLMTGTSSARMPLPLYVDLDASGEWRPLPILPFVVSGTRVAGVHGFAPSVVAPGEPFELSVRAEDAFFNRATGDIPAFEVLVDGDVRATTPAGTEPITVVELTLEEPGPHWVEIRSEDGEIRGGANPILVEENPARRIYWGDTHGHSGYAEGIGTIDFFMTFARDDARLDFVTHSEHDVWLDDAEWELSRNAVQAFDEPGRFIPYLGWEWTRHARFGGHHNVLFRDAEGRDRVSALEYPTLSELYQGLHARYDPADVLVIPHAHNPGDYRQSDPQLEPLIEMMSMHGTFEWFVRQYLSHGHQVGLVAASDDHLSHPGYSAPNRNSLAQRGGLGAVLAPEKSRDAIFDAMKQRRTYATTGDRIILDVTVNGTQMGQRGDYADERTVEGRVIGTAPIESVTLLKNDEPIWSQTYGTGRGRPADTEEWLLSFSSDATPLHPGDAPRGWRHWRGQLRVNGAVLEAITGTDFVNPTTQHVELEPARNGASFATNTRGDSSSLRMRLSGLRPSASIVLDLEETRETGSAPPFFRPPADIPERRVRLTLSAGGVDRSMPIDDYPDDRITLRRLIRNGRRDVRFSHTDEDNRRTAADDPRQGDYYYVRVRQVNDAMAWSSPVWVGGYPSR